MLFSYVSEMRKELPCVRLADRPTAAGAPNPAPSASAAGPPFPPGPL